MNQVEIIENGLKAILPQIANGFSFLKNHKKEYQKDIRGAAKGTAAAWNSYDIANAIRALKIGYNVIITENGDVSFDLTNGEFNEKKWDLQDAKVNFYAFHNQEILETGFKMYTFIEKPVIVRNYKRGETFSFTEDIYSLFELDVTVDGTFMLVSYASEVRRNKKGRVESRTAQSNVNAAIGVTHRERIETFGEIETAFEGVEIVGGKTFAIKEYLKPLGFVFDAENEQWVRPAKVETIEVVETVIENTQVIETVIDAIETIEVIETVGTQVIEVVETIETPAIEAAIETIEVVIENTQVIEVVIETPVIETIEVAQAIETVTTYTRTLKDGRIITCKKPVRKAKAVIETPVKSDKNASKIAKKEAFAAKIQLWIESNNAKIAKTKGVKTLAKLTAKVARLEVRLETAKAVLASLQGL